MAHPFLASRDFRALFLGDVVVTIAERYFVLTFSWWLLSGPEASGQRLSLLLALESVPMLAVGLLAGPLIERANKKHAMLGSIVVQATVTIVVAVLMARDALTFPLLCVAGLLLGCAIPIFEGASTAALPQAVEDPSLAAAAAMQSSTLEFSNIAAASVSAALLAAGSMKLAVAVNAALYVAGLLVVLRMRAATFEPVPGDGTYADDLKAGIRFITGRPALASFVTIYILKLAIFVSLLVFIPMLVQAALGGAVRWVAILETLFSLGAIATAIGLSLRRSRTGLYPGYAAALALLGGLMVLTSTLTQPAPLAAIVTLMGACAAWLLASSNILFHEAVPDDMKSRFFGILDTLAAAATPVGYAVVGAAFGVANVQGVLTANGLALVALGALVLVVPRVALRRHTVVAGLSGGAA